MSPGAGRCLRVLTGHTGGVRSVAITRDGRRALSGGLDHTVRWWDLDTGRCLHQVRATYVSTASITPGAREVVSGTMDGKVLLRELDWDYEFPEG